MLNDKINNLANKYSKSDPSGKNTSTLDYPPNPPNV